MRFTLPMILLINACATTSQDVLIESDPPGSRVIIDGNYAGETPLETEITRKKFSRLLSSAEFVKIYVYPKDPKLCVAPLTIENGKPTPERMFFDHHFCMEERSTGLNFLTPDLLNMPMSSY